MEWEYEQARERCQGVVMFILIIDQHSVLSLTECYEFSNDRHLY